MNQHDWRIVVAGEGGQGVQLIGEILAESAYQAGMEALYIPNFGVEQRGGVSIAMVQISHQAIAAPKFEKADILAPLSQRAIERTKGYISNDTIYIFDSSGLKPPQVHDEAAGIHMWDTVAPEAFSLAVGTEAQEPSRPPTEPGVKPRRIVGIPAATMARDEFKPRVFNMLILGAIVAASNVLPLKMVEEGLLVKLGDKLQRDPELRELNLRALAQGASYVIERSQEEGSRLE